MSFADAATILINDIRPSKAFTTTTFSGYKKTDVIKSFMKSLIYAKIEPACYWSAELLCSGALNELWGIIIQFYCRYIHIGNAKIAIYLEHKHQQWTDLLRVCSSGMLIQARNDSKIRAITAEIICILCDAVRKHALDPIKIGVDDFDMEYMRTRFKAPSMIYAEPIYHPQDPADFIIAINELAYHVSSSSRNTIMACYWVEWIHEFEKRYNGAKDGSGAPYTCETRVFIPVDNKYKKDIVWLIWDVLTYTATNIETASPLIKKIIDALLYLYCVNYTKGTYNKRKHILYFAVNVLCEPIQFTEPIIRPENREKCEIVVSNIDIIYKQIKTAEQSAGTDYLLTEI